LTGSERPLTACGPRSREDYAVARSAGDDRSGRVRSGPRDAARPAPGRVSTMLVARQRCTCYIWSGRLTVGAASRTRKVWSYPAKLDTLHI
jgi:hypothetical protein